MEDFDQLMAWAGECGCEKELALLQGLAEALMRSEYVRAAIVGSSGYECARLLNAAVGETLCAPSLLPRQEKSLRVAFDRAEPDSRFECVSLLRPAWQEHGALLYLLSPQDARDPAILQGMDVVFYVIPASTPGTQTDREYLSSLAGIRIVPVLTGLSQAEPDEQTQVRDYVTDMVSPLGMASLLEADETRPETIGARMREQLPLGSELTFLRQAHCSCLMESARQLLKASARAALRQTEEEISQQDVRDEAELQEMRQKSGEWAVVRSELLANGAALALSTGDALRGMAPEFAQTLHAMGVQAGFSSTWVRDRLPREMEKLLNQAIQSRRGTLMSTVHEDVAGALHIARELELDADGTFQDLDPDLVIQALEAPEKPGDVKSFLLSPGGRRFAGIAAVGTGAAMVFLLHPGLMSTATLSVLPPTVWAGLAAASDTLLYRYHHSAWQKDQWQDVLQTYSRGNCDQAAVALSRSIVDYYESIYLILTQLSFRPRENNADPARARQAALQSILAALAAAPGPGAETEGT